MSSDNTLQAILGRAKEEEERYRWIEALKVLEDGLRLEVIDVSLAAEVWQRIGMCYAEASRQAEDSAVFSERRRRATEAYQRAAELFENEGTPRSLGRSAQCYALSKYASSWLASTPQERRRLLDECLAWGRKGLEAYGNSELDYGKMCNDIMPFLLERLYISSSPKELMDFAQEGSDCASKAIDIFSRLPEKKELLRVFFMASLQSWFLANFGEQEEESQKAIAQKSITYSEKALELCQEIGDAYFVGMSNWAASYCTLVFTEKAELALEYASEMLKQGMIAGDNYLKGVASYLHAFITDWRMLREADPDRKKEGHKRIIKHCEDAICYLQPLFQDFFMAETCLFHAESYDALAGDVELNLDQRTALSRKAIEIGRRALEYAKKSGSPDATVCALHALSKALHSYSRYEIGKDQTRLLEEALLYRKEANGIVAKTFWSNDWLRGVNKSYQGLIMWDLAKAEPEKNKRRSTLESAISEMELGVSHCRKWTHSRPVSAQIAASAIFEDQLGAMLAESYRMITNKKTLIRLIEVYRDAAADFEKAGLPSRAAESCWKIAGNHDTLGERQEASEAFSKASSLYRAAAQMIPNFRDFYLDYATYMNAWSEIEKAQFAHDREDYLTAMKQYAKITDLLQSSKMWAHLSPNFLAWSVLERAENLSRNESGLESAKEFRTAAELFEKAKGVLGKEIDKIQNRDEKETLIKLRKASSWREEYCLARVKVEEAIISDKKGDHEESARNYGLAVAGFEKIVMALRRAKEHEEDIELIAHMCRAWQMKKTADIKASPKLYREASELFLKAKGHSTKDRTTLLALGNSAFCKALESGTRFEDSRGKRDFSDTKRYLESAADYFLRAGLENASYWTRATETLFDAYNYMLDAEIQDGREERVKSYLLAEKCLERSAKLYRAAGYLGKEEDTLKALVSLQEKKDFFLSLGNLLTVPQDAIDARGTPLREALHHTPVVSTLGFPAPAPTCEKAVGLGKFEHADIQGNLVTPQKKLKAGEDILLSIELINAGKSPASLIKIADVIPEGFDVVQESGMYCVEDNDIKMKGKQLNPLQVEEVRVILRTFEKGTFLIAPNILCLVEGGNQISCKPEPVAISVSEFILPSRVSTGWGDLDSLLFGGIPENFAVVMTSPSCDERDLLTRKFVEAGTKKGETAFYVTTLTEVKSLAEENQPNFHLFICNPQADKSMESLPNVFRINGVENLTEINIALAKAFRAAGLLQKGRKRACIGLVSDVLLQHHAVQTRRWLISLITDFKSKGFTTLMTMNPQMHSLQEVQAILDLFDGEISICERETEKGLQKFLKVKKMSNQQYLGCELPLRRERLER